MKKLLLLFLFLQVSSKAQTPVTFCPPGAEWHYLFNWAGYNPGTKINEKIKYTGDSIIGTDTVKVLAHKRFFLGCSNIVSMTLLKQKGDTVYFKNSQTQNSWQILYNFATPSGQSWATTLLLGNNTPATFTFNVTNVQQVIQNNFSLKELAVTITNNANGYTPSINIKERLGSSGFLFHYMNFTFGFCDADYFAERLCYQDSTFGLIQYTDKPCNFSNLVGLGNSYNFKNSIALFPNPAQDRVKIKLETNLDEVFNVTVRDISQREIEIVQITGGSEFELNTSNYQAGVYTITINKRKMKGIYTENLIIVR